MRDGGDGGDGEDGEDGGDGGDGGHLDLLRLRSVTRSVCQMGKFSYPLYLNRYYFLLPSASCLLPSAF